MPVANNPILPGFYPDPSICAVGEDFYLVNSTFAYFPGLPVMHSKDLAHWEQIGNVLDRPSQLPLGETGHSRGLFAPTIRYNNGTFYVICTNVSFGGNFIVTATDPAGPWSEPHYIEGADGIDPSLFFDEDGKVYYIGTHPNPNGCRYDGDWFIYIQEIDIESFKLIGNPRNVWNGAMRGVHWPEGPHLYHIGDYYYIIHAEGGTGPEHAVSVARSKSVYGPYENNFCNPIITHRHLGERYPIRYVGHADLVKTVNDEWYMVMLAVRPMRGYTTMGRETFLANVYWEKGWPVVNPGVGILTDYINVRLPEYETDVDENALPNVTKDYDFKYLREFGPEVMFLRNPEEDMYKFDGKDGLLLKCSNVSINEEKSPSYVCVRQDSYLFEARCQLYTDNLYMGTSAGLVLMQNNNYYLKFVVSECKAKVVYCKGGVEEELGCVKTMDSPVTLVIKVNGIEADCYIHTVTEPVYVAEAIDISALSTEVAGGFVGCTVGMYAYDSELKEEPAYAAFRSFTYEHLKETAED